MPLPEAARHCPACGEPFAADAPASPRRCDACGRIWYHDPKVATGVVVEHEGRILLVRRNHEPMLGRWAFPSGYVDAGELVEAAAAREVLEETGVEVALDRLLGVWSHAGDPVIFVAYAGHLLAGEARAGDEAFEVAWFAPDELPELPFPHDEQVIAAWRDR
jgi:8-oxo-dGTP diphosphatase